MDDTPGARIVQAPLLVSDAIYDRASIVRNLPVSDETLDKWLENGLPFIQPETKKMFFIGADVMEYFRKHRKTKGA